MHYCSLSLYCSLAFHHSKNMEILLQDWNSSVEVSLQSFEFLDDEIFWGTTEPSQRGFLNAQSNFWANYAL